MGRGRAKAKQVKVARQLKYNGGGTDLNRLRRSWASERKRRAPTTTTRMHEYDDEDALDDDDGDDEDEDDEDDWSQSHSR